MTGLDTNIIVRYLALEGPLQSPTATQIIEHSLTELNPGFVSLVTSAARKLSGFSDRDLRVCSPQKIAQAIERMLRGRHLDDSKRARKSSRP